VAEVPVVLEPLTRGVRWEALRLPGSSRQALSAVVSRRPPGACVLFHGPGKQGKAMVAEALATHLGLAAYRVDLGRIVSTHVEETERRLAAVFDDARAHDALVFFDEGDALFGRRRSVSDAHDRYANAEIAYLLQRLEAFSGLAILATNALRDVAPAVVRRCTATVGIPRTP
jgi:SpoVK/Ycf46/Vps4 family AAA+-type ATPase